MTFGDRVVSFGGIRAPFSSETDHSAACGDAGAPAHASEDENPDLFWAVRGTMDNFGIVTAVRVQWYDVPSEVLEFACLNDGYRTMPVRQTAFRGTESPVTWNVMPCAWWDDPEDDVEEMTWMDQKFAELRRLTGLPEEIPPSQRTGRIAAELAHGDVLPRLREIKRAWDPENVFHANRNIVPAVNG